MIEDYRIHIAATVARWIGGRKYMESIIMTGALATWAMKSTTPDEQRTIYEEFVRQAGQ